MSPLRAGMFVQQLLELETYRTFCLLGLPEAQRLQPVVRRVAQMRGQTRADINGGPDFGSRCRRVTDRNTDTTGH